MRLVSLVGGIFRTPPRLVAAQNEGMFPINHPTGGFLLGPLGPPVVPFDQPFGLRVPLLK